MTAQPHFEMLLPLYDTLHHIPHKYWFNHVTSHEWWTDAKVGHVLAKNKPRARIRIYPRPR